MLFWIFCALLTAGVVIALTRPLTTGAGSARTAGDEATLAVYRDQLGEIETDKARGILDAAEAEAARAEVARRLLAKARDLEGASAKSATSTATQRAFLVVAAAIPALSLVLYLSLGFPGLPGQPAIDKTRAGAVASGDVDQLVARVEAQLRANPSDGQGWDVLAPVYLRIERFREAADAYQRAIDLLGPTARRVAGLAEATVMMNNGVVTEAARKAYQRWLELEPGRPEARFGLAVAKEQDGDLDAAEKEYKSLLNDAPPTAPWREVVEERLEAVGASRSNGQSSSKNNSSPVPDERRAMIVQMVEGLEARLNANGDDAEGWQRLLRSWVVLGDKEKAKAALVKARRALANKGRELEELNAFAKSLGLES